MLSKRKNSIIILSIIFVVCFMVMTTVSAETIVTKTVDKKFETSITKIVDTETGHITTIKESGWAMEKVRKGYIVYSRTVHTDTSCPKNHCYNFSNSDFKTHYKTLKYKIPKGYKTFTHGLSNFEGREVKKYGKITLTPAKNTRVFYTISYSYEGKNYLKSVMTSKNKVIKIPKKAKVHDSFEVILYKNNKDKIKGEYQRINKERKGYYSMKK